jgi:hypothetical protein
LFFNQEDNIYSLVLEEFSTENGPRLEVYLASNSSASGFETLGLLRSTNGTLRYDFSPAQFREENNHVLIWCSEFNVNFGTAVLRAP